MTSTHEVGWFKFSYCSAQGNDCFEVAVADASMHVRDSEDVSRSPFAVGSDGWA